MTPPKSGRPSNTHCPTCGYAMTALDTSCPRCRAANAPRVHQPINPPQRSVNISAVSGWCVAGVLGLFLLGSTILNKLPQPPAAPRAEAEAPAEAAIQPGETERIPATEPAQPPQPAPAVSVPQSAPVQASVRIEQPKRAVQPQSVRRRIVRPQPVQRQIIRPVVRIGPAFHEVDARMDDRLTDLTEAQKQAYWQSVAGTKVTWSGEVVEVTISSGGRITLKCNPKTFASDTVVTMDGTQVEYLPSINKGQRITIEAVLQDHSIYGYTLSQGRIVAL